MCTIVSYFQIPNSRAKWHTQYQQKTKIQILSKNAAFCANQWKQGSVEDCSSQNKLSSSVDAIDISEIWSSLIRLAQAVASWPMAGEHFSILASKAMKTEVLRLRTEDLRLRSEDWEPRRCESVLSPHSLILNPFESSLSLAHWQGYLFGDLRRKKKKHYRGNSHSIMVSFACVAMWRPLQSNTSIIMMSIVTRSHISTTSVQPNLVSWGKIIFPRNIFPKTEQIPIFSLHCLGWCGYMRCLMGSKCVSFQS